MFHIKDLNIILFLWILDGHLHVFTEISIGFELFVHVTIGHSQVKLNF